MTCEVCNKPATVVGTLFEPTSERDSATREGKKKLECESGVIFGHCLGCCCDDCIGGLEDFTGDYLRQAVEAIMKHNPDFKPEDYCYTQRDQPELFEIFRELKEKQ